MMQKQCMIYVIFVHYADDTTPSDANVEISTKKAGVLPSGQASVWGIGTQIFGQFLSDPTIDSLLTISIMDPVFPLIN